MSADNKTQANEPEDQASQNEPDEQPDSNAPDTPNPTEDFDAWVEAQDESVQTGYKSRVSTLEKSLDKERDRAKETERELRDALKKLEGVEGAQETVKELESKLDDAQKQREAAERERDFVTEAIREGVTDPALAWRAVEGNETLTDRYGRVDFDALKEQHPALFAKGSPPPPDGTPGSGTGSPPQGKPTMDEIIRRAR